VSLTVTEIGAAFSHHEFQDIYEYMLDDIEGCCLARDTFAERSRLEA
jgi:hypothetical protein